MSPTDSLSAANDALQAGVAALARGDLETAQASFEQSLTHVPENHIALQNLAAIAAKRGALAKAETYLLRMQAGDETPQVLLDLGKIQAALGKAADAVQTLQRAVRLAERSFAADDPIHHKAKRHLAAVLQIAGDRHEAAKMYGELIEVFPADKDLVLAYAKLTWTENPSGAIKLIEHMLEETDDPAHRRDLLTDLILYKEIGARQALDLAPYHVDDIADMRVQHARAELDDLSRVSRTLLDTNPRDTVSLSTYANVLHAKGEYEATQEQYRVLAGLQSNSMASAVHFNDDFAKAAAEASFADVEEGLPAVVFHQEQDFGDLPVIVISSDSRYFIHFTRPLILSLDRHLPGACVHVHIMDASNAVLKDAVETFSSLATVRCALSSERTGFGPDYSREAASYFHAIRFVRFAQLRMRYGGPLWMIDADALANGNPEGLIAGSSEWDVAMRVRPGRLEPWNAVSAGLIGMANTEEATAFYTYVAAYIAQVWRDGDLPWGIDQLALLSALLWFEPRLRLLTPLELDVDVQPTGLFWFLSGRYKALFPDLRSRPDHVLSMLNARERRYADAYRKYLV